MIRRSHLWVFALPWLLAACGSGTSGDDVAGTSPVASVPATAPPASTSAVSTRYPLTVTTQGSGRVLSSLAGIDCGRDCSEAYADGSAVTLVATPADGFRFDGWSGACTGSASSCVLALSNASSVIASFGRAAQTCNLPLQPNTWTDWIDLSQPDTVEFPAGYAGRYEFRGWNGLTSNSSTTHLYEGYRDDHVGGYRGFSIYANAVYALDLAARRARMLTVSNWAKGTMVNAATGAQCHVTYPSVDTLVTPTPADRHPYGGFQLADNNRAILMYGANAPVQFVDRPEARCPGGGSSPNDMWTLDMGVNRWDLAMRDSRCTWCPPAPSGVVPMAGATSGAKAASFPGDDAFYTMVTHGSGGSTQVMRYDPLRREWTLLSDRSLSPGGLTTIAIAADTRRRRLVVEVLNPQGAHAAGFYTFDVDKRAWSRLETRSGTEPRTEYSADHWLGIAYDSRRDLYLVNGFNGLVAYSPQSMSWSPVSSQSFGYKSNLVGFTYDAKCDVLLARQVARHNVVSAFAYRP